MFDPSWLRPETWVDALVGLVRDWGYLGIFVMMTIESSFVPFPSEVALVPAGYLASRGEMDPALAVLAGVAGSLAGAAINYALAATLGRSFFLRVGPWVGLRAAHLERAEAFFARHGEITTFVGRLVPAVRQLVSIPAGLARMPLGRFFLFTALGAGLWSAVLVAIGWVAGATEALWRPLLRRATLGLAILAVALVGGYVAWHRRRASS